MASPVAFMFHGTGGDGEKFYNISGWKEKADAFADEIKAKEAQIEKLKTAG